MIATMSPITNHLVSPVMKLPGIRFSPCPTQIAPTTRATAPTVIRALRPTPLFMMSKLPASASVRCSGVGLPGGSATASVSRHDGDLRRALPTPR